MKGFWEHFFQINETLKDFYISAYKQQKEQTDNESLNARKQKYQIYLDERKSLNDAIKETAHQFDKAILTLAAGALALSLTFIKDIAPTPKIGTFYLLFFAWATFIISILATLISFFTSQKACQRQIKIVEIEFLEERSEENDNDKMDNPFNRYTRILNMVSIAFFILGVILLIIFSSLNFPKQKEGTMSDNKAITEPLKPGGGYETPSLPAQPPQLPPVKKDK